MTTTTHTPKRVAVYGTLRQGGALHDYYLDDPEGISLVGRGTIDGTLYLHERGLYPVLEVETGARTTVEVYEWHTERARWAFAAMLGMEQDAGYDVQPVTVTLDNGNDIYAVVCAWNHHSRRGPMVGGDWIAFMGPLAD